jgi:hypothetical protein
VTISLCARCDGCLCPGVSRWCVAGGKDELESSVVPLLLTIVLAYYVALVFLNVYHLAVETILLCFCEDRSCRKGTPVR